LEAIGFAVLWVHTQKDMIVGYKDMIVGYSGCGFKLAQRHIFRSELRSSFHSRVLLACTGILCLSDRIQSSSEPKYLPSTLARSCAQFKNSQIEVHSETFTADRAF
jgi:hypothetical protein